MSVDSRGASRNISGNSEIGNPQILDVGVSESVFDCLVETTTGEHGRGWVGQIQKLIEPPRHFLRAQI